MMISRELKTGANSADNLKLLTLITTIFSGYEKISTFLIYEIPPDENRIPHIFPEFQYTSMLRLLTTFVGHTFFSRLQSRCPE